MTSTELARAPVRRLQTSGAPYPSEVSAIHVLVVDDEPVIERVGGLVGSAG